MEYLKLLAIALLFFIFLPLAIAFDCNSLQNGDFLNCKAIEESDLTPEEKDILVSDILNPNKTFPDHDFIYNWNTGLDIKKSPKGKEMSLNSIKNAWVEIIAVMPSVLEDNILYVSDEGKLFSEYNYDVKLPSQKDGTDCKTEYSLVSKKGSLDVLLNNKLIGHDKLTSFGIGNSNFKNLNFKAELSVEVKYKVKHYTSERYCCKYSDDICERYCKKCVFASSETKTDSLELSDSLNAKLYEQIPESSFKVADEYYGVTKGILEAKNFTALILSFKDSFYQNNRYIYSLNYTLPYYILTLKADKFESSRFTNIHVDKQEGRFIFTVKNTENCKIELYDYFSSITKECDLSYNDAELELKTDKLNYQEGETIKIEIFPKNLELNLTYTNKTIKARNNAEFKAVLYENKIIAQLGYKEITKVINVNDKENQTLFFDVCSLSFFGYFIYSFLKKYYLYFKFI